MNTIKEGSKDTATVQKWQSIVGVKPDGKFGPATTAATKAFQRAHGLKDDGIVGPNTWAKAQAPKATPAATTTKAVATKNAATTAVTAVQQQKNAVTTPPPVQPAIKPTTATPTLREGSKERDAVARWQKIINVKQDGIFGPGTTAGTKVFQRAHKLKDDGIVGPNTWAAGLGIKAPAAQIAAQSKPPAATPAVAVQKKVETVNAATTAVNTIKKEKAPKPAPAQSSPPQTVTEVYKVTEKIVREKAAAVQNSAKKAKAKVVKHVQNSPTWLRFFAVGLLGIGGLVTYKAVNEPKRRSA